MKINVKIIEYDGIVYLRACDIFEMLQSQAHNKETLSKFVSDILISSQKGTLESWEEIQKRSTE